MGITLGQRLNRRKELFHIRRTIVDVLFFMGISGFALMVIETELYLNLIIRKSGFTSYFIKCFISGTTIVLLITVCMDYYVGAQIRALDAGARNLSSVMSKGNWFLLGLELLLCSFHPIPGDFKVTYNDVKDEQVSVSIDAVLSFLMIARLYLIGKLVAAHSRLMTDPFLNCIDTISKVKLNTLFYIKVSMMRHPFISLIFIMLSSFIVNTWAMRACRLYHEELSDINMTYTDALWMVATPFLTLGYGDGYPQSHCRRYISVCSAIFGVISTSMLVVLIWKHLAQSRKEEYVFNFISRFHINLKRKKAAADVLKNVLLLWISNRRQGQSKLNVSKLKDNLNRSSKEVKETKRDMEDLEVDLVGLADIFHVTERTFDNINLNIKRHLDIQKRMDRLNERLNIVEFKLERLYGDILTIFDK